MLNKEFIEEKIGLIQNELANMEKLSKYSFQEIAGDFLKQNAFERLLEKIVIRAIDINEHLIAELSTKDTKPPRSYKETFLRLPEFKVYPEEFAKSIAKSVGTRNVLVHDYNDIDYSKIYSSISDCLKDYHKYCDYILEFLKKQKVKK